METQDKDRSSLLIVRDGKFWKVRNHNTYIGGAFTDYSKAVRFVEVYKVDKEQEEFDKKLREIKKEPDIGKKTREYKKLCQNKKYS